jgi:hypothetical protein
MSIGRHIIAIILGVLVAGIGGSAVAKEAKRPKQTGRLAVTISRIGPKAPVGQPIVLRSRVSWSGAKASFTYLWSSVSGALPSSVDTTAKDISIPADELDPGQFYHWRLEVTARTEAPEDEDDGDALVIRAVRDVKFTANEPPSGGSCKVETKAINAHTLRVHLTAPGWTDPDGQVQYRFELIKGKRVVARQNWRLFSYFTTSVRLKPGEVAYGRCQIRDKFGDGGELRTEEIDAPSD